MQISRRLFSRALGGSAAAFTLGNTAASAAPRAGAPEGLTFPKGFIWGSATASYQVEGAVREGGRGLTVWDTFAHTPGKTHNGDTGDVADDFYHRFPDDIRLMKDLGLTGFRFSVAWSRIFPNGAGQPNQAGVDFYRRLVDALLGVGIAPFCTLFHWDLPQALQDKGGWENRDTAKAFADYAGFTAAALSDRVKSFMTFNEMRSFVELGYGSGSHAPGLSIGPKRLVQLTHHVVLAHGLSVAAIRAACKGPVNVGLAENAEMICPAIEAEPHIVAARKAMREENAPYLTVISEGRYTESYLRRLGRNAPVFTPEDMTAIRAPLDFVGVNCYVPHYVRAADSERGYETIPWPRSYPTMFSPWLKVGPEALYWGPKLIHELWNYKVMYITENGCSSADTIAPDGHVYDTDRVMYLRNYISQMHRGISEGIPVKGYFLWSLMDNFEWADGYDKRFGITFVDFKTQKRTPKLSAEWYKQVIRANRVV